MRTIATLIKAQRDTNKYIHDRLLQFANVGYTINELPKPVKLPKSLLDNRPRTATTTAIRRN